MKVKDLNAKKKLCAIFVIMKFDFDNLRVYCNPRAIMVFAASSGGDKASCTYSLTDEVRFGCATDKEDIRPKFNSGKHKSTFSLPPRNSKSLKQSGKNLTRLRKNINLHCCFHHRKMHQPVEVPSLKEILRHHSRLSND